MGKRLPYTPRSQIRSALRRCIWLYSRERRAALKRDGYTCQQCGSKQSKAKGREVAVEVDHLDGISQWEKLIDAVYETLLCSPDRLTTLCVPCHKKKRESTA